MSLEPTRQRILRFQAFISLCIQPSQPIINCNYLLLEGQCRHCSYIFRKIYLSHFHTLRQDSKYKILIGRLAPPISAFVTFTVQVCVCVCVCLCVCVCGLLLSNSVSVFPLALFVCILYVILPLSPVSDCVFVHNCPQL